MGLCWLNLFYRRVAEFTEYGDMSMMMQYLKDVQAVQKKTTELAEATEFINMVHLHFLKNPCIHGVAFRSRHCEEVSNWRYSLHVVKL